MDQSTRFKTNHAQIIQETFDDEVVIVNLSAGTYYSLGGAGTDIWNLALNGASVQQIATQLTALYEAERDEIQRETDAFLQKLQDEELLSQVAASENDSLDDNIEYSKSEESVQKRGAFVRPQLQKFTDMQALLMLDPIHEVDEAGWPNVKAIREKSPVAP